jgi:hypothetical protein
MTTTGSWQWTAPPNWPAPPPGWLPPPGWYPDPSWGPAPPDWQWWRSTTGDPAPAGEAPAPLPGNWLAMPPGTETARKLVNRLDAAAVLSWFLAPTGVALAVGGLGARIWGLEETGPWPPEREIAEATGFYGLFALPLLAIALAAVVSNVAQMQRRVGAVGPSVLALAAPAVPALAVCTWSLWLVEESAARYGTVAIVAGTLTVVWAVAGVLVFTARGAAARQAAGYSTRSHPEVSPVVDWPTPAPSRWRFVPLVLVGLPVGIMAEGFLMFVVITGLYGT